MVLKTITIWFQTVPHQYRIRNTHKRYTYSKQSKLQPNWIHFDSRVISDYLFNYNLALRPLKCPATQSKSLVFSLKWNWNVTQELDWEFVLHTTKLQSKLSALRIHVQCIRFRLAVNKNISHMTLHSSNIYIIRLHIIVEWHVDMKKKKKIQPTKNQTHTKTVVSVLKCGKKKKLATSNYNNDNRQTMKCEKTMWTFSLQSVWVFCCRFFSSLISDDGWYYSKVYKLMNSFLWTYIYHTFVYSKSTFSIPYKNQLNYKCQQRAFNEINKFIIGVSCFFKVIFSFFSHFVLILIFLLLFFVMNFFVVIINVVLVVVVVVDVTRFIGFFSSDPNGIRCVCANVRIRSWIFFIRII